MVNEKSVIFYCHVQKKKVSENHVYGNIYLHTFLETDPRLNCNGRGNIYSLNQMNGIKRSIEISKGSIICLMDSDDFFKKYKVKEIVNFFYENPKKEILFDKPIIFKNKNDKNPSFENYFSRERGAELRVSTS